jgi:hypothetical protein
VKYEKHLVVPTIQIFNHQWDSVSTELAAGSAKNTSRPDSYSRSDSAASLPHLETTQTTPFSHWLVT